MNNFAANCCPTAADSSGNKKVVENTHQQKRTNNYNGSVTIRFSVFWSRHSGSYCQSKAVSAQACELQLPLMVCSCQALYQIGITNTPNDAKRIERPVTGPQVARSTLSTPYYNFLFFPNASFYYLSNFESINNNYCINCKLTLSLLGPLPCVQCETVAIEMSYC